MRVKVLFWKDPKNPGRGFREEYVDVPVDVIRDMFRTYRETRNANRAVDVVCGYVVNELAERFCRAMGVGGERFEGCVDSYVSLQGERVRVQCETAVRMWIANTADCIKECGMSEECVKRCVRGS